MNLVCMGNTIVDVMVAVDAFPEHGGDVLARSGTMRAGGAGFNVMCAASRLGATAVYGGMHGTGPFGEIARKAMAKEGIEILQDPDTAGDTGWDIAITDATAERTFITVVGAESHLTAEHLARVAPRPGDIIYLSGYGLLAEPQRTAVREWLATVPLDVAVMTDPGPLVGDIPVELLDAVLARTTWLSANAREASIMTGESDPVIAATLISTRLGGNGGVVLRRGAVGCLLVQGGRAPQAVPGVKVDAIDTNGAGDAHVGAFIASLLDGLDPLAAARRANAAAAYSVTRAGPATSPTTRELEQFLARER